VDSLSWDRLSQSYTSPLVQGLFPQEAAPSLFRILLPPSRPLTPPANNRGGLFLQVVPRRSACLTNFIDSPPSPSSFLASYPYWLLQYTYFFEQTSIGGGTSGLFGISVPASCLVGSCIFIEISPPFRPDSFCPLSFSVPFASSLPPVLALN